jgi:hypothetical protein
MVPWVDYHHVLNCRRDYDPVKFLNEVLGLPTALGDHIITREEIESCCENRPMASRFTDVPAAGRGALVAGIDWGGGSASGTVPTLGYIEPNLVFRVVRFDRWVPHADPNCVVKELTQRCKAFRVRWIAADGGGNGYVYNRLLLDQLQRGGDLPGFYAIHYSASDQEPVRDGALWKYTVNRSATIGLVFTRIKKHLTLFPRVTDIGTFLDEFICERAVYDEEMRTIKYTKPENLKDDSLHSTNYAQLLALRMLQGV